MSEQDQVETQNASSHSDATENTTLMQNPNNIQYIPLTLYIRVSLNGGCVLVVCYIIGL